MEASDIWDTSLQIILGTGIGHAGYMDCRDSDRIRAEPTASLVITPLAGRAFPSLHIFLASRTRHLPHIELTET